MGNGGLEVIFPEEYLLSGFEHHGKKKSTILFFPYVVQFSQNNDMCLLNASNSKHCERPNCPP